MSRVWIKQVQAIRKDGHVSTVNFHNGFNLIVGPSNTGKSRVLKAIRYVCGEELKNSKPFTDKTKYTIAQATFVTERGEVTLSREVKPGASINVESTDPTIESGRYSAGNGTKKPINSALLAMLGFSPDRKILKNQEFTQIAFTWDRIDHLMIVPEGTIGRDIPSLLFPKSVIPTTMTSALAALLVMIQDENFNENRGRETSKERSTRKKAVSRFVYTQLDTVQRQLQEAQSTQQEAARQGATIETYLANLQQELETITTRRNQILDEDEAVVVELAQLHESLIAGEILVKQRGTLATQYRADLERLDLQIEAANHQQSHPNPDTCQFCHSQLENTHEIDIDVNAIAQERERIESLLAGVQLDQEVMSAGLEETNEKTRNLAEQHKRYENELREKLNPQRNLLRATIQRFSKAQQAQAHLDELLERRQLFETALDDLEKPAKAEELFKPRELFTPGFFYEMTKNLKQIFKKSNHPGADRVTFDKEHLDVAIDGYLKSEDQGKGFTAYFNTLLMVAFHMYLNRNSPHAPGFLVIDTPFHGFDQGKHDPDRSMSRGLIKQLVELGQEQQVIVFENTDKLVEVDLTSIDGVQEFSKDPDSGRYGYLEGVWDSGDDNG